MSRGRGIGIEGPTSDSIDLDTDVRHQHGCGLLDRLSKWLSIWGGKAGFEFGLEGAGHGGFGFTEGWWLNRKFGHYAVEAGRGSVFGLDAIDKFATGAGRGGDECGVGAEGNRRGGGL